MALWEADRRLFDHLGGNKMPKRGKKYQDSIKSIEKLKLYDMNEAVEAMLGTAKANFDERIRRRS